MKRPYIRQAELPSVFWTFAKKDPETKCWVWQRAIQNRGGRNSKGYGKQVFNGKREFAHRVAWQLKHGAIPKNRYVLHSCDNPPCINPKHLFLGTAANNTHDAVKKKHFPNMQKTCCPQGHPYTGYTTRGDGRRFRYCRPCSIEAAGRSQARRGQVNE